MAKKTKKRSSGPRLSESQRYKPGENGIAAVPMRQAVAVSAQPADADLVEEYRYVLTDLKKIAWLALAMLALLIVLAFIVV
jgi:hypothetical protein